MRDNFEFSAHPCGSPPVTAALTSGLSACSWNWYYGIGVAAI
ncbi:hypothetical protein ACH4JS_25430 [Streptomyces sp. NPDC017638]